MAVFLGRYGPTDNSFQYILQEIEAFKAHVRGLRQMVALRGGIDSLDRFGFFKRRVIKYGLFLRAA